MVNWTSYLHLFWLIPSTFIVAVFINFCADVLPVSRSLRIKPVCMNCKQTFDIINYITVKQCTYCNTKRSHRFVFILFLIPLILVSVFYFLGNIFQWLITIGYHNLFSNHFFN